MKFKKVLNNKAFIIIGVITGFTFITSLSLLYMENIIPSEVKCACTIPIPLILVSLASLGLFTGSLVYYLITAQHEEECKARQKEVFNTLDFLESEEKTIIKELIENNGELKQNTLVKNTGLSRVKVSRLLKKLEQRNIIIKEPLGKINVIKLKQELSNVFKKP